MFLRDIGKIGDESLFHAPTAIAIDRQQSHLYLLDSPRGVLFVLDLNGNVLKRVGTGRGHGLGRFAGASVPMDLSQPTAIASGADRIAVLDVGGSRIRVMNPQFEIVSEFTFRTDPTGERASDAGLAIDSAGYIYVSDTTASIVRVYDQKGQLKTWLGNTGNNVAEFSGPSGLCIDSRGRIFVADTNKQRIQVFQSSRSASIGGE
jgi:DNA-binding beta-propeller fold protein YncE